MLQNSAKFSKLLLPVSSKVSSKTEVLTTKDLSFAFDMNKSIQK